MKDRVDTVCPCCDTRLTVDTESGEILAEERPKNHEQSFDSAMESVRGGEQRRQDAFDKAFQRTQNLDSTLQKKFEEAAKKAAKDPSKKHRNPLDWD